MKAGSVFDNLDLINPQISKRLHEKDCQIKIFKLWKKKRIASQKQTKRLNETVLFGYENEVLVGVLSYLVSWKIIYDCLLLLIKSLVQSILSP